MSGHLWKYYLEDDVDAFRQLLEGAAYNVRPGAPRAVFGAQGATVGSFIGSPGSLGASPTLTNRARRDFSGMPKSAVTLTRAEINSKDANGLTILHHAASSASDNAFGFATALLDHPLTDLYAQDLENGWTALHRAFYFGNISIARSIIDRDVQDALGHGTGGVVQHAGGLIKIKDKEGNGPLDLFVTTIKDRTLRPDEKDGRDADGEDEDDFGYDDSGDGDGRPSRRKLAPSADIHGDELFTFGSNRNVTLGFGDEDDRQYPERIALRRPDHLLRRFHREHLDQKYQDCTSMESSLGDLSQLVTSRNMAVSDLPTIIRSTPLVIQDVQMSKLHTAVLTTDPESNLYMCGHGPGGRLGTGNETTRFQFTCIEGGALAHKKVIAVALGQNHSLALSDEGEIFSWGNNAFGQLGYTLPKTAFKDEDPIQTLPRQIFGPLKKELVIGISASRIHSVAHTATSLYTFGKNEGQLGIVDSDARSLEIQVTPRKVAASLFSSPIKSVSAIERATVCLLENHEVWVFANYGYAKLSFPLDGFSNYFLKSSFLTTKYDTTPNRICRITSGGDTICAMSSAGEVFTVAVSKRTEPGQDNTTSTTNPSKIRGALSQPYRIWSLKKGHMAARDVGVDQDGSIILTTEAGSVWRRVKRAKIKDATASGTGEYRPKDYKFLRVPGLTRVTAVRASAFGAYAAVRKDCDVTKSQINGGLANALEDMYPLLPFRDLASQEEDSDDENPMPAFWNRPTDVQRLTKQFRQFGSFVVPEILSLERDERGRTLLMLQGMDILTVFDFILYIYTDNVIDFWHYTRQYPQSAFRYRQIRTELMKLASRLELKQLEPAVRQMVKPKRSLTVDMEQAIRDPAFFEDGDVILELADGELRVHSGLLVQRCPFFEGMFKGRAAGLWLAGRREVSGAPTDAVNIDLKHIELNIFELVLRHLYADTGDELFDDFVSDNLGEFLALNDFLDHVMDVMSVANELMLDRLSQVCQQVVGRYVNVRNVCQLVNAISPCSVTEFKDAALEYICLSLEAVLQNGLLDELDEDLLFELDQVVRENQLACLPFAKSGRAEALLLEKYPELAEQIDRRRRAKVDAIIFQNKYADGIGRTSSSLRAGSVDELSTSPMHHKARRRSGKDAKAVHSSPLLAPTLKGKSSTADLMFDMDDDVDGDNEGSELDLDAPGSLKSPSNIGGPVRGIPLDIGSPSSPWPIHKTNAGRDASDSAIISPSSQTPQGFGTPSLGSKSTPINRPSDKPWGTAQLQTSKLDLKNIMAETSSTQPSNISLALSAEKKDERAAGSFFTTKLSQKERKKLQQQQTTKAEAPASASLESTPASPWQVKSSGAKVALKDVLNPPPPTASTSPASRTSSTPHLTMRQTIANNGPTAKAKAASSSPAVHTTPITSPLTTTTTTTTATATATAAATTRPQPSPHQPQHQQASNPSPSTSNSTKGFAISQRTPSALPQSIRHIQSSSHTEASLQLSMADILSQQQAEKDVIRDAVAKRSLQEIQQEQAFQEWWDKESKRVMEAEQAAASAAAKSGRGAGVAAAEKKGKGGGGGGVGGGKGKGGSGSVRSGSVRGGRGGGGGGKRGSRAGSGIAADSKEKGNDGEVKLKDKEKGRSKEKKSGKEGGGAAADAEAAATATATAASAARGDAAPRGGGADGGGRAQPNRHHRRG